MLKFDLTKNRTISECKVETTWRKKYNFETSLKKSLLISEKKSWNKGKLKRQPFN